MKKIFFIFLTTLVFSTSAGASTHLSLKDKYGCDIVGALRDIGRTEATLQIDCSVIVPDGVALSIPETMKLSFAKEGSIDGTSGGRTEVLLVRGQLDPVLWKIFGSDIMITGLKVAYPEMWGAVPDGAPATRSAMQAAADSLAAGGRFVMQAGTYLVDGDIAFTKNNVEIAGAGDSTIVQFDNSTDPYAVYRSRVGIFNLRADNITAHHFKLDQNFRNSGRRDGDKPRIACLILGGHYAGERSVTRTGMDINNITCYDYYGDGISGYIVDIDNVKITDNKCISTYIVQEWSAAGSTGEQGISLSGGANQTIARNHVYGALDDAIATHGVNKNVEITDNTITTTGGRILVNGIINGVVSNNTITYIQDGAFGILVSNEKNAHQYMPNDNVQITGNTITVQRGVKIGFGIRVWSGGRNLSVSNNHIKTVDKQGTGIMVQDREWPKDGKYYNCDNCKIIGNTISGFVYGISEYPKTTDPVNLIIADNTIIDCDYGHRVKNRVLGRNKYINVPTIIFRNKPIKNYLRHDVL